MVCFKCGSDLETDTVMVGDGQSYCQDCWEGNFVSCYDCGEAITRGNEKQGSDGNDYCDSCFEKAFVECANCHKTIESDDSCKGADGNDYCDDCHCELFTCCYACNDCIDNDDAREGADGNYYCESCWESRFTICYNCDNTITQREVITSEAGDNYCQDCYYDNYCHCEDCGCEIHNDDAVSNNNGTFCSGCARSSDFEPAGFVNKNGNFGSDRKFGIELETNCCDSYEDLEGSKAWGAKDDCSVDGKEFVSDILDGNDGLAAIDELCDFAKKNRWKVGRQCGYHLHLDMRGESKQSLIAIAAAYRLTYTVWCDFVDETRVSNNYCHASEWTVADLMAYTAEHKFSEFATRYYRYQWFNLMAYGTHKTFEIRLHQGSLNAKEIKMWVKAHTTFADYAAKHTPEEIIAEFGHISKEEKFDKMCKIWTAAGCADVADYYKSGVCV